MSNYECKVYTLPHAGCGFEIIVNKGHSGTHGSCIKSIVFFHCEAFVFCTGFWEGLVEWRWLACFRRRSVGDLDVTMSRQNRMLNYTKPSSSEWVALFITAYNNYPGTISEAPCPRGLVRSTGRLHVLCLKVSCYCLCSVERSKQQGKRTINLKCKLWFAITERDPGLCYLIITGWCRTFKAPRRGHRNGSTVHDGNGYVSYVFVFE